MTTNYIVQFTTPTGADVCKVKTEGDFLKIMAGPARQIIAASAPGSGFHPLESAIINIIPDRNPDADMNIRQTLPTGEIFYTKTEPQTEITMIRWDKNGRSTTLIDRVFVPTRLVNQDCNGDACKNLLRQIVKDFAAEHPDKLDSETATWNNLFDRIPNEFLERYSVRIEPVDTMLTLEVSMDEPVLQAESE